MIIQNNHGDIWEDIFNVNENSLTQYSPLTHSLIVVKSRESYLLVFDRYKEHWELPGGMIDPGETARECAIRELKEEANQDAKDPVLIGVMKFQLMPDHWNKNGRTEYGTLFYCEVNSENAFIENDEISKICFWDRMKDIGKIDPIDAKIIEIAIEQIEKRRLRN